MSTDTSSNQANYTIDGIDGPATVPAPALSFTSPVGSTATAPAGQPAGAATSSTGTYTTVTVADGGATFVLDFVNADNPTASFEADIEKAAGILSTEIRNDVTFNLVIGYGEVEGQPLTGGEAAAGPAGGFAESYSTVRSDLIAANALGASSLPTASPFSSTTVDVWDGQAKALGLLSATGTEIDGYAGFATDVQTITGTDVLPGVAIHELTHALGRVPDNGAAPDIFDLYRFTSPGNRLVDGSIPAPAAYFSIDGGNTTIADYGQNSDPSDFLNAAAYTPQDPLNEFYDSTTIQNVTGIDTAQLRALGFGVESPASSDLDGDGTSDILFQNGSGQVASWTMQSGAVTSAANLGNASIYAAVGTGDFNGNGTADIVLQNPSGQVAEWTMQNGAVLSTSNLGNAAGFAVVGTGDFTGGGTDDILFQNSVGQVAEWVMQNGSVVASENVGNASGYAVVGTGDFTGTGTDDILLQNSSGQVADWTMLDGSVASASNLGNAGGYQVVGTGDFTGSGTSDILLQNSSGQVAEWIVKNGAVTSASNLGNAAGFTVVGTGDYNGTGTNDILFQNSSGQMVEWAVNNGAVTSASNIGKASGFKVG